MIATKTCLTNTGEKCEPYRLSAGALMTALLFSSTWLLHIFTRKESKIQGKMSEAKSDQRQATKRREKTAQKAIPAHALQQTRTRDVLGSATKWKWELAKRRNRAQRSQGQRQEGQRKTETEQVRSPINKWPLKKSKIDKSERQLSTIDAKRGSRAKERELPPHPRGIRRNEGTHMESEQFEIRCERGMQISECAD